jgi:hypothetical protein
MSETKYVTLSGDTYPHRVAITAAGGRYNNVYKQWTVPRSAFDELDELVNPPPVVNNIVRAATRWTVGPTGDELEYDLGGPPLGWNPISAAGSMHGWSHTPPKRILNVRQVAACYDHWCTERIVVLHIHTAAGWASHGDTSPRPEYVGFFTKKPGDAKATLHKWSPIRRLHPTWADLETPVKMLRQVHAELKAAQSIAKAS